MSLRELRQYIAPITRLAVGLVVFTIVVVALVVRWALPDVNWFAALAFGAIVAPTDALAASTVFRRVGAPRAVVTLIEGEALFNDATALVAYRFAVAAAVGGAFVLTVIAALVAARFAWIFFASFLPDSPRRTITKANARLAWKLTFVVGWAGLRGAVSLAAALALPASFPERDIFLLVTFAVILVTLVVGGLSLPWIVGRTGWDGVELDGDETTVARAVAYRPDSWRLPVLGRRGPATSRCSSGWSPACAIAPGISPPTTQQRPRNAVRSTPSTCRSSMA